MSFLERLAHGSYHWAAVRPPGEVAPVVVLASSILESQAWVSAWSITTDAPEHAVGVEDLRISSETRKVGA